MNLPVKSVNLQTVQCITQYGDVLHRLCMMMSDSDLFSELYRTLKGEKFWNFMELYNGYDGMEQL